MTAPDLPLPPVPVHDLASALVTSVQSTLGIELDYTSDTLPILDHYVRTEVPKDADAMLGLVAPMCGAYFGEVLRRSFGGLRWFAEGEHGRWRLEGEYVFIHFNPIALALECIVEGEYEGWSGHFQLSKRDEAVVAEALDLGGQIDEEDYYRFAIRYETLEQVLNTLVGLAEQRAKHADDTDDEASSYIAADVYAATAEVERESPTLN